MRDRYMTISNKQKDGSKTGICKPAKGVVDAIYALHDEVNTLIANRQYERNSKDDTWAIDLLGRSRCVPGEYSRYGTG